MKAAKGGRMVRASDRDLDVVYQIGALAPGGTGMTLGIRYHDTVARVDDGWRIRRRRTELLWTKPA